MEYDEKTMEYIANKIELFVNALKNNEATGLEYAIQILSCDLAVSEMIKDGEIA